LRIDTWGAQAEICFMKSRSALLVYAAAVACATPPLGAAQGPSLRDHIRQHGRDVAIELKACGPLVGLKAIVQHTRLTVEGTVASVESSLTPAEDDVYTEFVIDVIRVFRLASPTVTRSTPGGPTDSLPFVAGAPVTRPAARTMPRIRLRKSTLGRVELEGYVVTASSGFPMLTAGQHVIVSALFNPDMKTWAPFAAFEVRDGRVVALPGQSIGPKEYGSVEVFAAALANPPATIVP
jgi:hypothetical protein